MTSPLIAALFASLFGATVPDPSALAHATGDESRSDSECNVLPGSALGGARGECLRCIARPHYHYHMRLPRRERCHRENRDPSRTTHHHRHH